MAWLGIVTILIWSLTLWCAARLIRARGLVAKLNGVLAVGLLGGLGLLFVLLLTVLHACERFSHETLVARVTTQRLISGEAEVSYQAARPSSSAPVRLRFRGDQWVVSGGIIKWHPWLTALGVPSYHRPMRLSGQLARLAYQASGPPPMVRLGPDRDWSWELAYRLAPCLPFIEAVYGSSAYSYVEPGWTQEVYVTASGYLIKRGQRILTR